MNFVTQCTNCQTFFKIVPDQIKLRGGMVRCGVCAESFNALESLHQIPEAQSSPDSAPSMQDFANASDAETKAMEALQAQRKQEALEAEIASQTSTPPAKEPQAKQLPPSTPDNSAARKPRNVFDRRQHIIGNNTPDASDTSKPASAASAANLLGETDKRSVPVMPAIELPANNSPTENAKEAAGQPLLNTPVTEEEFAPMMRQMKQFTDFGSFDFLDEEDEETLTPKKRTEKKSVEQKPKAKTGWAQKLGWGMLAFVMVMLFFTQMIWYFRVPIETNYPNFYYIAQASCELFGCEAKPVLRKGQVELIYQQLTPVVQHNGSSVEETASLHQHELRMTIRNPLSIPQQWPSIELQLFNEITDSSGQTIPELTVRKVIRPAQYLLDNSESLLNPREDKEVSLPLEINAPYEKANLHLFYE